MREIIEIDTINKLTEVDAQLISIICIIVYTNGHLLDNFNNDVNDSYNEEVGIQSCIFWMQFLVTTEK